MVEFLKLRTPVLNGSPGSPDYSTSTDELLMDVRTILEFMRKKTITIYNFVIIEMIRGTEDNQEELE